MTWTVRLRAHDGGRVMESATYGTPDAALEAYRVLLARPDLIGRPVAAVFKPPSGAVEAGNVATLFSRFDAEIGRGRIAPDDPRLDPWLGREAGHDIAHSLPPAPGKAAPRDWEADPRPFQECLHKWQDTRGGKAAAAAELRVPISTYDGWLYGRGPAQGQRGMVLRLMTLIDRCG